MPWQEQCVVELRQNLIQDWLRERNIAGLARRYGVSRKTADKWIERFLEEGRSGLVDRSRRPHVSPYATPETTVRALIELRHRHTTWSAKKLLPLLRESHPHLELPSTSTASEILKRAGLVCGSRRRRFKPRVVAGGRSRGAAANDIWCVDYKGQFKMKNGRYCYPLTVSDESSRYLLACHGYEAIRGQDVRETFMRLFQENGLPHAIRSDNGSPFASTGLGRLSRVSVWWMRLGIRVIRNAPGHPEHNGRHERIHRDLKAETTRPPEQDLLRQQRRFDVFLHTHNHERPHEALAQQTPARHYRPSTIAFPKKLPEPEYPGHFEVRKVARGGTIKLWGSDVYLSDALAHQYVGLIETQNDEWTVWFGSIPLAVIDRQYGRITEPPLEGA